MCNPPIAIGKGLQSYILRLKLQSHLSVEVYFQTLAAVLFNCSAIVIFVKFCIFLFYFYHIHIYAHMYSHIIHAPRVHTHAHMHTCIAHVHFNLNGKPVIQKMMLSRGYGDVERTRLVEHFCLDMVTCVCMYKHTHTYTHTYINTHIHV